MESGSSSSASATSSSAVSSPERPLVEPSRTCSQNLQHHLWDRERGYNRRNLRHQLAPWHQEYEREFYKSITPNLTIQNIDHPHGYIRKFTPDGQFLLSFTHDQRCLEVYKYGGCASLASLLEHTHTECITAADEDENALQLRQRAFEQVLQLRWNINLAPPPPMTQCHLNREFSIFLDAGRYVLLCSVSMSTVHPPFTHIFEYPDLNAEVDLFAYTFYLIDLQKGELCDLLFYAFEYISLSHNHGVSADKRTIAVLSKYRQCIDLVQVTDAGKFTKLYSVGPFGLQLPESIHLQRTLPELGAPQDQLPLSHIKQRVFAYIYREIWESTESVAGSSPALVEAAARKRREKLKEFYRAFKMRERLLMTKMQLIDDDNLLIQYEHPKIGPDEEEPPYGGDAAEELYVFYNISRDEILKIYAKNSIELLFLLRDFCDNFRNVRSLQTNRPPSSPSNDVYVRAAFDRSIKCISDVLEEAAVRFNPTLPISTQGFATSHYLDYSLFNYDDHFISVLERPKITCKEPIRFSDRLTGTTKFRLFMESGADCPSPESVSSDDTFKSPAKLVAFICHPFEPFIVSIQRIGPRFVTNFHVYNQATVVQP